MIDFSLARRTLVAAGVAAALVACSQPSRPAAGSERPSTPRAQQARPTPTVAATASGAIRYVAIGASDTVGVGATDPARGSWPARIAALLPPDSTYVNLGVSGSLAAQAQREQLSGAVAGRPSLVTVWLAVNDLNAGVDPASYATALGGIVDALVQRSDATLFVGNVPDLRAVPAYASVDKTRLAAAVTAYNTAIADVASRHGKRAVVVDLFTGSAALVSTATISTDGFHPSDAGYELIADRFASAIRAGGFALRG